jgi:hypothetical protein
MSLKILKHIMGNHYVKKTGIYNGKSWYILSNKRFDVIFFDNNLTIKDKRKSNINVYSDLNTALYQLKLSFATIDF